MMGGRTPFGTCSPPVTAVIASLVAALAVVGCGERAQTAQTVEDPFEKEASCEGRVPGPEPGRTVLQICVPRLVRALVDNGLVDAPEAKRLQPIVLGRMGFAGLGGAPVVLRVTGGPRRLDGVRFANRARTTVTARIDIVSWNGRYASPSLSGHRELALRPGTRLVRRSARTFALISDGRDATIVLRPRRVVEDP
jgi:hypothetical protein